MLYSGRPAAILDACVLYPAPLRDLLLSLAEQELYRPKWSTVIQDEWRRNLLKNRDDTNLGRIHYHQIIYDIIFI